MKRISSPIESCFDDTSPGQPIETANYLVIGSGYGGAVAAARLAGSIVDGKSPRVVVLERGKEYLPGDFAYDVEDIPAHIRLARGVGAEGTGGGYADALFNLHVGLQPETRTGAAGQPASAVDILVGSGLGGTSLINANVAERPSEDVLRQPEWPYEIRNAPHTLDTAFDAVEQQLNLTQRTQDGTTPFGKFTALERVAKGIGASARPATIAVSESHSSNTQGITQPACSDCGNCITGCNTGAKNSLDRNLLRLARSNGAVFYTGATALYIEPNPTHKSPGKKRWRVHIRPTVTIPVPSDEDETCSDEDTAQNSSETVEQTPITAGEKATQESPYGQTYFIETDNVILAAGTLGSTEILQRSSAREHLSLSPRLGHQFSSNGDGIAFSYGQTEPVHAVAQAEQNNPTKRVGPTITGMVQTQGLTIEDASVPAAMQRVFAELTTTGAMLQRLGKPYAPRFVRKSGHDPLAASTEVAEHGQALLIMGDDGGDGLLRFDEKEDATAVALPGSKQRDSLSKADTLLSALDRRDGLDGGQYVPNPLWQLMPAGAGDALSGAMPPSRALTVHPLGGCPMGDSVATGVVNHAGQVFNANGCLYEGLYVFDGAIVPRALQVNPFLTIAALSWRNCDLLLSTHTAPKPKVTPEFATLGDVPERQRTAHRPAKFAIEEQMLGALPTVPEKLLAMCKTRGLNPERLRQRDGLVVNVTASHNDADVWLNNPGAQPLQATMSLYVNPIPEQDVLDFQSEGVRYSPKLDDTHLLLELEGKFSVLCEDDYSRLSDWFGGVIAVITYRKRRLWNLFGSAVKQLSLWQQVVKGARDARAFFNIGITHSRFRRIRYRFYSNDQELLVCGDKVLGYAARLERLWPALLNLNATVQQGNNPPVHTRLRVNSEQLIDPGLVKMQDTTHLPQSLLFAGGLASFFARNVFATHFWELGGADVPPEPRRQQTRPRALHTKDGDIDPELHDLYVPLRRNSKGVDEGQVPLLLTNYRNEGKPPVLMLHGLAQGSQIFWTDSIENNLANYFYDEGFDVWLLDYRLSNHILPAMPDQDWTIDEIVQFDIPHALEAVCDLTDFDQTAVVAHCVGACALAMAALSDREVGERVSAAVTNAIHPWVIASSGNKFRAKLGGMYREWVPRELLNPIPGKSDTAIQNVMDRVGFGLARLGEAPEDDHKDYGDDPVCDSICDRMTFLYGRMWNHSNLARETHNAFQDMLGPAPIGVYQHLYHFTREQRITDRRGENVYLTRDNIENHWNFPILFVHGGDSRVFNPHAARRSAQRLAQHVQGKNGAAQPVIDHKIYPGYGHMDVIFGKDAHEVCFGDYVEFIRTRKPLSPPAPDRDWQTGSESRLVTGPILRAAWRDNDKIHLRFWAELKRSQATLPSAINVSGAVITRQCEIECLRDQPPTEPRFRLVDVELDAAQQPVEIQIASQNQAGQTGPGHRLRYNTHGWLAEIRKPKVASEQFSFLLGSCRYPGSLVDNDLSDKVYEAMLTQVENPDGAHMVFFTGDQIYADATDQVLEIKSPKTRYSDRYRTAFSKGGSPNFARLVKQVPTHFSLDDHELTDNWSGYMKAPTSAPKGTDDYALDAATHFMGSGRPQMPLTTSSGVTTVAAGHRHPFHYPLLTGQECAFPVYLADTRAERTLRTARGPQHARLMDRCDKQIGAIEDWLLAAHNSNDHVLSPKFIVSGSIVAPLPLTYCEEPATWRQQDGWAGYPATLERLLAFICENQIQNVIFVGGDAHLSAVAEMTVALDGKGSVLVRQIVGSGLYAPLPFANSLREHYHWDVPHTLPVHVTPGLTISCTNTFLSDAYSQFVRVNASRTELEVSSFDNSNQRLSRHWTSLDLNPD